jgi:hypothetical protein
MELQAGAARGLELPMLKQTHQNLLSAEAAPRRHYLSFVGNPDNGLMGLRREMIAEARKVFSISTGEFYFSSTKNQQQTMPLVEFTSVLEQSEFVLCPRGFGPTSYRFYEALSAGAIPVYVWEGELVRRSTALDTHSH